MLTALPVDDGPGDAFGFVVVAPRLFPVVPWLSAFEVFGPGPPPVPLMVFPFERVPPVDPLALPVAAPALEAPPALLALPAPPELCARANELLPSKKPTTNVVSFIDQSSCDVAHHDF